MEKKELLISLYDGCQYHCSFCMYEYVKETQPLSQKNTLTEAQWEDLFRQAFAQGYRYLNIGGRGEPTLHPAFSRLVAKAYKMGFQIYLLTNGLNDKAVIEVLPLLWKLKININAVDEHHVQAIHQPSPGFSVDRCITAIKNIVRTITTKKMKVHLRTNYVVTTQSLHEAFSFPQKVNGLLAQELGDQKLFITYLHFHNYVKTNAQHLGFDEKGLQQVLELARAHAQDPFLLENTDLLGFIKHTEDLMEKLHHQNHCYTCEAHQKVLFVDGNGDCYGCYAPFRAVNGLPINKDPFFFGNLHTESFDQIISKSQGFEPVMDVSKPYWRNCLSCVAKGPLVTSKR